ncbi:MAG: hypothetical protein ACRBF0_21495 [Calditrichia bacterium]
MFNLTKRIRSVFTLLCFLLLGGFALSCSGDDPTGNTKESLRGTITVNSESDHAGIAVEIYPIAEIDENLQAASDAYSGSGPAVGQMTEFNPTGQIPEYSTVTSADGSWNIDDMDPGNYNIVYRGGKVGLRIETDVEVPGNPRGIQVNPKVVLQGLIANQSLNITDAAVEIIGNTQIESSSALAFSGTNYLIFTNSVFSLTVRSDLNFQPSTTLTVITTAFTQNSISGLNFQGQNNLTVRGLIALDDLRVQVLTASLAFADCMFRDASGTGANFISSVSSISRSLIRDSRAGVNLEQMNSFNCDNSIYLNNDTDILASINQQGVIEKNTFLIQREGIECGSSNGNTVFEIRNNLFRGGEQQILLGPNSIVQIHHNQFEDADKHIHLEPVSHPVPSIDVNVNFNNFMNTGQYALELENTTALQTVDALNNYWGTVDISAIDMLIFDRNDRPNDSSIRFVNYTPFETALVTDAGIGGN